MYADQTAWLRFVVTQPIHRKLGYFLLSITLYHLLINLTDVMHLPPTFMIQRVRRTVATIYD